MAPRLTEDLGRFVGSPARADMLRRACATDPRDRFPTVVEFGEAWLADAGS